jgi:hypothetical protein
MANRKVFQADLLLLLNNMKRKYLPAVAVGASEMWKNRKIRLFVYV